MSAVEVAVWLAAAVGLVTMPRWLGRSLTRHSMWRLRDDVALGLLEGRLPKCQATYQLLRQTELSIAVSNDLTLLRLIVFSHAGLSQEDVDLLGRTHTPDLSQLDPSTADAVSTLYGRLKDVERRHMIFGSWLGLLYLLAAATIGLMQVALAKKPTDTKAQPSLRHRRTRPVRAATRHVVDTDALEDVPAFVASAPRRELAHQPG